MKIRTLIFMSIVVVIFAGCSSNSNQDHDVIEIESRFTGTWEGEDENGDDYTVYINSEGYSITRTPNSNTDAPVTITSRARYGNPYSPADSELSNDKLTMTITAYHSYSRKLMCKDVFTLSDDTVNATLDVSLKYYGTDITNPNNDNFDVKGLVKHNN